MARLVRLLPILAILLSACTPIRRMADLVLGNSAERMAQTVTIHRDAWGVPHIIAPTDAAVMFGMAWAQAEDDFRQLEDDILRATGRTASLYGEAGLEHDLVRAAFDVERLAHEEYLREPPERRKLWDAWADGLNYYIELHPDAPRAITRVEPWFVFAIAREVDASTVIDGVRAGDVVAERLGAEPFDTVPRTIPSVPYRIGPAERASNAWAVAPERTANGRALLLLSAHTPFFGSGRPWEVSLLSDEGWHFSGYATSGSPVPLAGHNEHLAWAHTSTAADAADAWIVTFDDPDNPLAYRWDGGWRDAVAWEDTLLVATPTGQEATRYRFWRTQHGPVVRLADGRTAALRIARFEDGGALQQRYAMGRATSLDEFRAALANTALHRNTMAVDTAGNILYVHGNAVPRRAEGVDPSAPLDGSSPQTEWQGYHELEELPQLLNPSSGWIQNTGASPFLASDEDDNPDARDYPAYMAPEPDNARARMSRRILMAKARWTVEEWAAAAFDTRIPDVETEVAALVNEWERLGAESPERTANVDPALEALRKWDGANDADSGAATVFLLWQDELLSDTTSGDWPRMRALERVVNTLKEAWGMSLVPWGEVNRLQRVPMDSALSFDDDAPSLRVAGGPPDAGVLFAFETVPGPSGRRRYGVRGLGWAGIIELGDRPSARTIASFGQSGDPSSRHWFDQAALYVRGELKPARFWRRDIERWARQSYGPGPIR